MRVSSVYNKRLTAIEEAERKVRIAKRRVYEAKRKLGETLALREGDHTRRVRVDSSDKYDVSFPKDAVWISPSGLFFVRKVNGSYFLYDDPAKAEFADFPTLEAAKRYVKDIEKEGFDVELNPWEDPENYR